MIQKLQFYGGRTDRGVSEVLGAILIFALVLAMLVIVQTAAVPAMNQQIEFAHNQRVQGDMQSLGEQVDFTVTRGAESSTTVEMGVNYPTRIFLLNPPPASGSLTTEPTTFSISNARATDGETADYWNGDERPFDSRRLTYAPNYNEYGSAPNTVYEGWTLYNEHPNGEDTGLDRASPISDNRIRLVALDGTRTESSVAPVTVTTEPLSVPEQTVTVSDDGQPITLRLATNLSAKVWNETLPPTCADGNNDDVCDDPDSASHVLDWSVNAGTLTIVLEKDETYELRLAKVGIGSQATDAPPYYMTAIDRPTVINPGGAQFTVEVRDEFNTAQPGVPVTFSALSGAVTFSDPDRTVTTNENGRATIGVEPQTNATVTILAEADLAPSGGSPEPREQVYFQNLPVGDDPDGRDSSDINPSYPDGVLLRSAVIGGNGNYVDVTWENMHPTQSRSIDAMRVNFYSVDSQGTANTYEVVYADVSDTESNEPSVRLEVQGPYEPNMQLQAMASNGGEQTYRFEFDALNRKKSQIEDFAVSDGDFFIVSIVFDDETTARYFIGPRSPPQTGGGNNP